MFFRYLDYLSPHITFYYKGYLSHSSIISGILSIVAIVFVIILIVYFSLDIIQRNNPNTFYFNTFVEDSGIYELNRSSLFHFINFIENSKGNFVYKKFDFSLFNIIGMQVYVDNFINNIQKEGNLFLFDHWIYGYCDINKNIEGLEHLITYDFFGNCACIQKYYNKDKGQYFDIGDPNFVWPTIEHGTFNSNNKLYGIYIQKCQNDIISNLFGSDYQCKNSTEIEEFLDINKSRFFHFYFINNYINILNYSNPNNQFFYRLESPLHKLQYSSNDININPSYIKTHYGLVLDRTKVLQSYIFDRNDVYISERKGKNLFMSYCFFLKNTNHYYERTYKRIQEVISNIGGINQAITIIAIYLNTLYNNYIVLSDTEVLLNSAIHTEKKIHRRKAIQYNNLKNKGKEIQKINDIHEIKKSSTERKKIHTDHSRNKGIKNSFIEFNNSKTNNNCITNIDSTNIQLQTNMGGIESLETLKKENLKYIEQKNFRNFFFFKITCGKRKKFFKIYESFRMKIISEEHLIRNHLNIYNLLKVTERKRHTRKNSYQIKHLMNLV